MSAQVFPAVIQVEQESQAQEALIDLGFEFDWQTAARGWREGKAGAIAFHKLPDELNGIALILDDSLEPLNLPFCHLEQCDSDAYTKAYLRSCPESLQELLGRFPELQYFLTQWVGIPICDASNSLLQNLGEDWVSFNYVGKTSLVRRQIKITEEDSTLVISGSSMHRHWSYGIAEDLKFFLESDEATLRIPIDPRSNRLMGKAKLSSVLLLKNLEGRAASDFQQDVRLIQNATEYGMLDNYIGVEVPLTKTKAEVTILTPPAAPKKFSLLATPIFSGSLFAGAALVATLVFAVAPPLGLGLVASALIMAGIGVLIGAGINALRVRKSSQTIKTRISVKPIGLNA